MKYFENLARREFDREAAIKVGEELKTAGIPIITLGSCLSGEVKTHYIGELNGFVFERAWKYWVVKGYMPLEYAEKLYEKHKDALIRVCGHAGNLHPKEWAYDPIYAADCRKNMLKFTPEEIFKDKPRVFPDKNDEKYRGNPLYIDTYHIDTEEGLKIFSDFVWENNIHTEYVE